MKKIIGIMAVAAMATSMFAVDVTAQVKLGTKLFDDKKVLTTPESTGWDDNHTYMKMSVAGDNVGAEIHVSQKDLVENVKVKDDDGKDIDKVTGAAFLYGLSLWFKPVDAVKVTVGNNTAGTITKGTFAWWGQSAKIEGQMGIKVEVNVGSLGLEFLVADNKSTMEKEAFLNFNNSGYDMLSPFWLAGKYSLGSAGTIQAFVTKGAEINAYGVGGWKNSMNDCALAFGAAYDHMPWQQTGFYGDVLVNFAKDGNGLKFDEVGGQIGGQYCANGLAVRLVGLYAYGNKYGTTKFDAGFVAKASYAIDAFTPFLQLFGNGIMDKSLTAEIGVDFNVGSCAINAYVSIPMNFDKMDATKVTVPVSFTVAF